MLLHAQAVSDGSRPGILCQTNVLPLGGFHSNPRRTLATSVGPSAGCGVVFVFVFVILTSLGYSKPLLSLLVVSFCQLLTNIDVPEKRELHLRSCLHQIGLWTRLWSIFLVGD